jgi:2'-5' RNA ligase
MKPNCACGAIILLVLLGQCIASFDSCEKNDEDCPQCWPPLKNDFTTTLHLSQFPDLVRTGGIAQAAIQQYPADIIRMESLLILHTSIQYMCCYSSRQYDIFLDVIKQLNWHSFNVNYTGFGCNLDRDNVTIYVHALPNTQSQTDLLTFIHSIEAILIQRGVPINHPRTTLFHMTLARVKHSFPVDAVVAQHHDMEFGTIRFCQFEVNGVTSTASDCR